MARFAGVPVESQELTQPVVNKGKPRFSGVPVAGQKPRFAGTSIDSAAKPSEPSDIVQGLKRGTYRLGANIARTGEAVQTALGGEKGFFARTAEAAEKRAAELPARVGRVEDIGGVGDVVDYAQSVVAEQTPQFGPTIAGAAIGSRFHPVWGTLAGAALPALAQNIGEQYGEQREQGVDDPTKAIGYGSAASALDVVTPGRIVKRVLSPGRGGFLKRAAKGAVEGTIGEGVTETGQEELAIRHRATYDPVYKAALEKPVAGEPTEVTAARKEIGSRRLNAAVAGALVGGTAGSVGGVVQKRTDTEAKPDRVIENAVAGKVTPVDTGTAEELRAEQLPDEIATPEAASAPESAVQPAATEPLQQAAPVQTAQPVQSQVDELTKPETADERRLSSPEKRARVGTLKQRIDDMEKKVLDGKGNVDELIGLIRELHTERSTDELTGLKSRTAWNEAERLPAQASIDLDGLKKVNDEMGHLKGDEMFRKVAAAFKETIGDEVYRVGGDEFVAQAKDAATLDAALKSAQDMLSGSTITATLPDGSTVTKHGIEYSYVVDQTYEAADAKLKAEKDRRAKAGLRAETGGKLPGLVKTPAQGQPTQRADTAEKTSTSEADLTPNLQIVERGTSRTPINAKPNLKRAPAKKAQPEAAEPVKKPVPVSAQDEVSSQEYISPKLKRDFYRTHLKTLSDSLVRNSGGEMVGGDFTEANWNVARGKETAVQRLPSLNPEWFKRMNTDPDYTMSVKDVQAAVNKALSGKRLGMRQARIVQSMIDQIESRRTDPDNIAFVKAELKNARDMRQLARQGIDPDLIVEIPAYIWEQDAGRVYEEVEYQPDWSGQARSLFELSNEAEQMGLSKEVEDILSKGVSDLVAARQILTLIGETNAGRIQQRERTEDAAQQPEKTAQTEEAKDLFGEAPVKEQRLADAKRSVDEKLKGTEDVPVEAGEGDLFSGRTRQRDFTQEARDEERQETAETTVLSAEESYTVGYGNTGQIQEPRRAVTTEAVQRDLFASADLSPEQKAGAAKAIYRTLYKQVAVGKIKSGLDVVKNLGSAAHVLAPFRKHGQETMLALVLDKDGKILNLIRHTKGLADQSSVNPALLAGSIADTPDAAQYVLAHNHPSGDPNPSRADKIATERIQLVMDGTDIDFMGHVVLGEGTKAWGFNDFTDEPIEITALPRKRDIEITERIVRKVADGNRPQLTQPQDSIDLAKKINDQGIVLLDNKHRMVGFIPINDTDWVKLKGGKESKQIEILSALSKTNTVAAVIVSNKNIGMPDKELNNVAKFLTTAEIRVLDHIASGTSIANTGLDPAPTGVYFSKYSTLPAGRKALGMRVDAVEKIINEHKKTLNGAHQIDVIVVKTQKEVLGDREETIKGFYSPKKGSIVLISENMDGKSDVIKQYDFEVIARYGKDTLDEKTQADVLKKLKSSRDLKSFEKIWADVDRDYAEATEDVKAWTVFGRAAATPQTHLTRLWNEIMRIIQSALRKMGMFENLTKTDLRLIAETIADNIRRGETNVSARGEGFEFSKKKSGVLSQDKDGSDIEDLNGVPVPVNEDGTITLYHRTTPEAAKKIKETGQFISAENTDEVFFSTTREGYAEGYGDNTVEVRVNPNKVRIDDAFRNGEVHVAVERKDLKSIIASQPSQPESFDQPTDYAFDGVIEPSKLDDSIRKIRYHNHRRRYPNTRGGWTKEKIKRALAGAVSESSQSNFEKAIMQYDSADELEENIFYHGSGSGGGGKLKPSIKIPERELRNAGGGYGERYWGISLSKNKNMSSNFTGTSDFGTVYQVVLKKGAVIKNMPEISDAVEIEDHIEKLWDDGVDAVKIGDWSKESSEQELVVLNPRAIVTGNSEGFRVFQKKKMPQPSKEEIKSLWENSANRLEKRLTDIGKPIRSDTKQQIADFKYRLQKSFGRAFKESDYRPKVVSWAKEKWGDKVADNGKPVWQNFVRWFGDSKVVDEDGSPLVVYHWTDSEFDTFDTEGTGGSHFGTKQSALDRAGGMESIGYDIEQDGKEYWVYGDSGPMDGKGQGPFKSEKEAKQFIAKQPKEIEPLSVYLSIKNPIRMPDLGVWNFGSIRDQLVRQDSITTKEGDRIWDAWNKDDASGWSALKSVMAKYGYDGIVYTNEQEDVGSDSYLVLSPNQIKSTGNIGTFSGDPNILYSKTVQPKNDTQKSFLQKAGLIKDNRSIVKKIIDYKNRGWDNAKLDIATAADKTAQGLVDRFHAIKLAEQLVKGGVLPAEQSGYVAARLSTGIDSVMKAVLTHGAPVWKGNIVQRKENTKGLLEIFQPVQNDMDSFLGWMVARRAKRLLGEGRERNFTAEEINEGLALAKGKEEAFEAVAKEYDRFRKAVLDLAEQAGLIDATTRPVWDKADHIPFYRMTTEKELKAPGKRLGLSGQTSGIRTLKGGEAAINDPLENIIMNFTHLIDASMKNHALRQTIVNIHDSDLIARIPAQFGQAMVPMSQIKSILKAQGVDISQLDSSVFQGIQKMWSFQAPTGKDVIRVMDGGKAKYYRVNDQLLLQSLTAIHDAGLNSIIAKALRAPKRLLTAGVTASPDFMLRNFIRDSVSAWVISENHFRLGLDSFRGAWDTLNEGEGTVDMMFSGASFLSGYIDGTDPGKTAKAIRRTLRKKGFKPADQDAFMDSIIDTPAKLWEKYRGIGDSLENASREAVYKGAIKAGKSKAQAVFEAKDLMDFSMQGSWSAIQWANTAIPFLNARLQGLYKLGRSGAIPGPGMRKVAMMRGLGVTMFSLALYAMNYDNDDYEELEDWDKDTYWHLFIGEHHFRIPKPFEIGVIFGTAPERAARLMLGADDAEKSFERFLWNLKEVFAFSPLPQAVTPGVELYANKDTFTGRPIENMSDANKLPADRYNERTSDIMRMLGRQVSNETGISPKQMEHLWTGYLGTMGAYSLSMADYLYRLGTGAPSKPGLRADQIPLVKSVYRTDPPFGTKYQTEFYDMLAEANQVAGSINAYRKTQDIDKARELLGKYREQFKQRKFLTKTQQQAQNINKQMDAIYRDTTMSRAKKRDELDKLLAKKNSLLKKAVLRAQAQSN